MQLPQLSAWTWSTGSSASVRMAPRNSHEHGVLALPADPSRLGQRLFHQRGGIDEHLDLGPGAPRQQARQLLELALDQLVIVAVAGIDGDIAAIARLERQHWVGRRPVIDPEHDDRACLGPERSRTAAPRRGLSHPVHVAVPAGLKRRRELFRQIRPRVGRSDAEGVEAKRLGAAAQFGDEG